MFFDFLSQKKILKFFRKNFFRAQNFAQFFFSKIDFFDFTFVVGMISIWIREKSTIFLLQDESSDQKLARIPLKSI